MRLFQTSPFAFEFDLCSTSNANVIFIASHNVYVVYTIGLVANRIERIYATLSVAVLSSCPLCVYTCNTRVIAPHHPQYFWWLPFLLSLAAVGWHSFLARYKGDEKRKGTTMTTFNYIFQCMCESAIKSLCIISSIYSSVYH